MTDEERSLSFRDAAIRVLEQSGRAMTVHEIVRAALEQGLIVTAGKTPEATLAAALYRDVTRNPDTPFRKLETPGQQRALRGSVRWALRAYKKTRDAS